MMNYVGSISIIDRGDAPAQAVIDKNVRSLAQRVADETKDELDKVMDRVDNIYVSYEMSTQTMFDNPRASPNVEYIEDIKELEEIIKDTVKKKKYQQQVTIFIVGFQDACSEKMQLLQQVNQFFLDNSKLDEEELVVEKPEIDMDECSNKINESLKTAEELTKKISDLNQDMIEWLVNWANTKASNKGKKRLEKSLETAKNDMALLQEKLLNLQTELEEKDEKFQQLAKQLDAKTQEVVRYKTAAEVAKSRPLTITDAQKFKQEVAKNSSAFEKIEENVPSKSAQDNESHTSMLQNEIAIRDEKIKELRQKLTRMEINLTESQFDSELHQKRFNNKQVETQQKLQTLQEEVDAKKIEVIEAEREMERLHREQLESLEKSHREELEELKAEHQAELTKLTEQVKSLHGQLSDAERDAQQAFDETDQLRAKIIELQLHGTLGQQEQEETQSRESSAKQSSGKSYGDQSAGEEEHPTSKQESRPSTKDTKSSKRSEVKAKIPSRSPNRLVKERSGASRSKEYAEVSVQDDNGDHLKAFVQKSTEPSRQATRQSKNLQPVEEINIDFQDTYELEDEESWASVPANHIPGRFLQYRKLTTTKIKELQDQLNITLTKTHRKVNSLKSQFTEHKKKWESERKVLIEQVEQAQKLQTEAEKEADAAMTQLEEFINEQEKLEDEEESKRQEVLKVMSRPGTVGPATPTIAEPTDGEQAGEEGQKEGGEDIVPAESSDQELRKLMQQTDDAKVALDTSANKHPLVTEFRTGTSITYDSGASQLAPWLTPVGVKRAPAKEGHKSSSESASEPCSQLTDVVDAEFQEIIPANEKELLAIEDGHLSKKSQSPSNQDGKSLSVSMQHSRSRMLSGFKSRSSTKLQHIHTSVDIDEEEEEEVRKHPSDSEEDWDDNMTPLAPWLTPAGVKKQRSARNKSDSSITKSRTPSQQITDTDFTKGTGETIRSRAGESRLRSNSRSRTQSDLDDHENQNYVSEEKSLSGTWTTDHKHIHVSRSRSSLKDQEDLLMNNGETDSIIKDESRQIEKLNEIITSGLGDQLENLPDSDKTDEGESVMEKSKSIQEKSKPLMERAKFVQHILKIETSDTLQRRSRSHMAAPKVQHYSDSDEEELEKHLLKAKPPEILVQESTMTFIKESKSPGEKHTKEKSKSDHQNLIHERSRSPKAKAIKEKSRSPKRTKSSFEKPKLPDIRPRSFRSEGHEDDQKDSGIEQSGLSDIELENVVKQERTKTVKSRSARNRSSSGTRVQTLIPLGNTDPETLEPDVSKSSSESLKSIADDDKVQYLDDGTSSELRIKSASRKTSLQEQGQFSRLTNSSVPIELASGVGGEAELFEDELKLPGLSAARGESVTDDVKSLRSSRRHSGRESDAVDIEYRQSKLSEKDSVRSGANMILGKHRQETPYTIQSERRQSDTVSTASPRKMMVVTVDVLAGLEAQASRASGAISAPPAIEPGEDVHQIKEPETVREDYESRPASPDRMRTVTPSTESEFSLPPSAGPKKAFGTPRQPSVNAPSLRLSSSSSSTMSEVDLHIDEGVDIDLSPAQSDTLNNLKKMMTEENLTAEQQRTLDEMRSALKSVSEREALKDIQLERTVTILSLASQIAKESVELGVVPDSVFNSFANMDSRAMSELTDSIKGHSAGKDKGWSAGTDKRLWSRKSVRAEPVIVEQIIVDREYTEHSDSPFNIVMNESKDQIVKDAVRQQEKSIRHRQPSASKVTKRKEAPQKLIQKEKSDLTLSGSMDLDYRSSRGLDSFSDSLPRTVPSDVWQELSQEALLSPIRLVPDGSVHEMRKELVSRGTQSEISLTDLKVVDKGMFTSSPKKKRPITKEEMLYGETSMNVGPSGDETELDIIMMEDTNPSGSKTDQDKDSSFSLTPDLHKDSSLPRSPKSVTRSSRALTPHTSSSQRSRSKSQTSTVEDHKTQARDLSRQTSQFGAHTPVTPAYSMSSVSRPLSPESYQGEPTFLTASSSHHVTFTTPTPDQTACSSPVPRPVSISSVHPNFDLAPPPELCKATQTEPLKWSESKIEHEPITGKTEDEIRVSSAKSRASLRKEFKTRLEETRSVVEDRRAKSPAISVPSQKSLDEDQLIIDEEDDDLPIPDDMKVEEVNLKDDTLEAGTSPPPASKPGQHAQTQVSRSASKQSVDIAEHPVVQEYLKIYRGVHNFKDTISRLLEDKDQMSASQILADLDSVLFDQSNKVQPQLENMTDNVYYVLNEVSQVINSIIHNDRGPVVSSLMMGMSRDPTQRSMIRERSSESVDVRQSTQQSQRSIKVGPSPGVDRQQYRELQEKYETLQGQLSEEAKKYEEQLRHNTVVMMEMQDTINELQRELSALGKTPRRPLSESASTPGGSQNAESAVMFTRLDSDRNARIMKKAVIDEKLDPASYKEAMVQMDEYVNLPAQRLAHLVRKYVHHCRMKDIEENVKKSKSLNENVFNILDKMEELQNQRAKRWADRMDEMGMERLRIANQLMETLDTIEQQSGIFLIKPMYSYRGREPKEHYAGKVSRPFRPTRALSPLRDLQSAYAPAPTPASNMRTVVRKPAEAPPDSPTYEVSPPSRPQTAAPRLSVSRSQPLTCKSRPSTCKSRPRTAQVRPKTAFARISQEQPPTAIRAELSRPLEGDSQGLTGSTVNYVGTHPKATWSMADSQPRVDPSLMAASLNTPRILELDINRMMIGQNTISALIGSQGISNDRLVNASNSNLRSYMTVNRPAVGPSGSARVERPLSGSRQQDSPGPPSSPVVSGSSKGVRIPNDQFSSTPPLPPIGSGRMTPKGNKGRQSPRAPSISPPGSSLRQTPPGTSIDVEIIPTVK